MSDSEVAGAPIGEAKPPQLLQQLANPVRWQLIRALAKSDQRVNELVARLDQPGNLISYHLRSLRRAGIVVDRRSSADARDVYYALDLERVRTAFADAASLVHPGIWGSTAPAPAVGTAPSMKRRVLFLCSHNSARSQMAEVVLRTLAGDRVEVHSAGTHPDRVHPLALHALRDAGYATDGLRAKGLDGFAGEHFDFVITLCDQAREDCPAFPGGPDRIHWSLADPGAVKGSGDEVYAAFQETCADVELRVRYFLVMMQGAGSDEAPTSGGDRLR